jgi:hypothetical protein
MKATTRLTHLCRASGKSRAEPALRPASLTCIATPPIGILSTEQTCAELGRSYQPQKKGVLSRTRSGRQTPLPLPLNHNTESATSRFCD